MTVFANGMEISAKGQGCKLIAAMPDVCMTPPQTPATPPGVPIPYPNFGLDSDLASGSTTVKISGKPVSMENKSKYSKCSGDEAGCAPKKGIITSKNTGPVYAQAWSSDVKVEGKGVVRFGDIATSNHGCNPGQPAPMVLVGTPGPPDIFKTDTCLVGSYKDTKGDCAERGGQAHHIIPDEYLRTGTRDEASAAASIAAKTGKPDTSRLDPSLPSIDDGCCICVGGNANGSAANEANPTTADGIANKASIEAKGLAHSAKSGKNLATMRGHGFLHQIDDQFRKLKPPSVENAQKTADKLLDEVVTYEHGGVDADCAKKAKECVEKQMAPAKAKKVELNQKTVRSPDSIARRLTRLKLTA
jgi:uncharacterized Zn-binding protein involved in type VI secretion